MSKIVDEVLHFLLLFPYEKYPKVCVFLTNTWRFRNDRLGIEARNISPMVLEELFGDLMTSYDRPCSSI
ncbi:hypothetical protein SLW70_12410 [Flavobacterium sp. NG2]|uniref:hypothetical protein n=1 Tax=Flavobacterium sp. NG2 TaxID=3097547 RepID=UPI002A8031FF|nr:hypothetical protein [Flavobacterium sp. NG2]WPR70729.1 hypothetical protein SLW70_12410 [Flavobacterium sp. NG2]